MKNSCPLIINLKMWSQDHTRERALTSKMRQKDVMDEYYIIYALDIKTQLSHYKRFCTITKGYYSPNNVSFPP